MDKKAMIELYKDVETRIARNSQLLQVMETARVALIELAKPAPYIPYPEGHGTYQLICEDVNMETLQPSVVRVFTRSGAVRLALPESPGWGLWEWVEGGLLSSRIPKDFLTCPDGQIVGAVAAAGPEWDDMTRAFREAAKECCTEA